MGVQREAPAQQLPEPIGRVAGPQVSVPLVGLADRVAEAAQQRPFEVRRVHDEPAPWPRDSRKLRRELGFVWNVLEHVDDDDAVELGVAERQAAAVDFVHVAADQLADRGYGIDGHVGGSPVAAALPQQQAHDTVVGAEVEAAQARRRAELALDLGELALLEHRASEQPQRPGLLDHGPASRSSRRITGEPNSRLRPSEAAPDSKPRASGARRNARCRAIGSTNCGRRAVTR